MKYFLIIVSFFIFGFKHNDTIKVGYEIDNFAYESNVEIISETNTTCSRGFWVKINNEDYLAIPLWAWMDGYCYSQSIVGNKIFNYKVCVILNDNIK